MEADKCWDLPRQSTSWKPRRADGVVSVEAQKPENQGNQCRKSKFPLTTTGRETTKANVPLETQAGWIPSSLGEGQPFCPLRSPADLTGPPHIWECTLLYSTNSSVNLPPNILTESSALMFGQISAHPLPQSTQLTQKTKKINHHTNQWYSQLYFFILYFPLISQNFRVLED